MSEIKTIVRDDVTITTNGTQWWASDGVYLEHADSEEAALARLKLCRKLYPVKENP